MSLLVIQGAQFQTCQMFARDLQRAGYLHFDLMRWAAEAKRRPNAANVTRFKEARVRCKSVALTQVLKGKKVVITTDYFRAADRMSFDVVGHPVEVLTLDRTSQAYVSTRIRQLVCHARPRGLLQSVQCAWLFGLSQLKRKLAWN